MIANPVKSLILKYSIEELHRIMPLLANYLAENIAVGYKHESFDSVINEVQISKSEDLSVGVLIVVNLNYKEENITEVTIEVQRKIGSFNRGIEVTNANIHLNNLVKALSYLIQNPDWKPTGKLYGEALIKENQQKMLNKSLWIVVAVFIIVGVIIIWKIRTSRI